MCIRDSSRTDVFGRQEYIDNIRDMVRTLYNHPSIVTWVPFNEGWGQFSTKKITDFIHRLDPSRLVDSASGWFDQGCGCLLYTSSIEHTAAFQLLFASGMIGGVTEVMDTY